MPYRIHYGSSGEEDNETDRAGLEYEEMLNEDEAEEGGDVAADSEISTASPDPYFFRTTGVDLEESPYPTQDPFAESETEQDENPIAHNTDSSSSGDGPSYNNIPWQNDTARLLPDSGPRSFRGVIPRMSFLDPSLLNNHNTATQTPSGNLTETDHQPQNTFNNPSNYPTDSQSEHIGDEESRSEPTSGEASDEHWIPRLLMLPEQTSRALTRQLSTGEQRFMTTRAPWLLRDIFVYDSEGYDASDHSSADERESSDVDENQFCEPITMTPEQEPRHTPTRCVQPDCLNRAAKECCNKSCGRCCRLNRNFCLRHGTESNVVPTET